MRDHRLRLLENGEEFFPRVFETIRSAQREVLLETFIWFEDGVGRELRDGLAEAARRGASVEVLVDGFGTPRLSEEFLAPLLDRGVRIRCYDPRPPLFGIRLNPFGRMHRKIVVVDGERAFVGGINFSDEHLLRFGPQSKQDYAVEVTGPVVREIRRFCAAFVRSRRVPRRREPVGDAGPGQVLLVPRDNAAHRCDIERMYRAGIDAARREVTIANAYFFPGRRFLDSLCAAARRGVEVRLILQGCPDKRYPMAAAGTLYEGMLASGVRIYGYCKRPLHAKVAVVDDEWATIGSSNLDPLSLSVNLEANLLIRDRDFAGTLRARLQDLVEQGCEEVTSDRLPRPPWRRLLRRFAEDAGRRLPGWIHPLPAARSRLLELGRGGWAPPRGRTARRADVAFAWSARDGAGETR